MTRYFFITTMHPKGVTDMTMVRESGTFPNNLEIRKEMAQEKDVDHRTVVIMNIIELTEKDFFEFY